MRSQLVIVFLGISILCVNASAFQSHMDTADLLKPDQYQLGIEPQYIFNNVSGFNAIAHFDMGATEVSNFKFELGTGVVPLQMGGYYKWSPFPDIDNQPAIGGYFGVLYSYKNSNVTNLGFRAHPEVSKKFKLKNFGDVTPYGALPFGIAMESGNTTYPIQLAAGAKWLPSSLKHMNFWFEVGLELNQAFTYASIGLSIPFDTWDEIKFD